MRKFNIPIQISVPLGTAPLIVDSATEVDNLRAATASSLHTARTIAVSGDGVGTATAFDGSANISIPLTLASVATAGTYKSVTVNAKGLVTSGTNPTTLAGYGITDAAPSSHVGLTGSAHGNASASVAGFMSSADKTKLDGIAAEANAYVHPATHSPLIISQDESNRFVTDVEKSTWENKASKTYAIAMAIALG